MNFLPLTNLLVIVSKEVMVEDSFLTKAPTISPIKPSATFLIALSLPSPCGVPLPLSSNPPLYPWNPLLAISATPGLSNS